MKKILVIIALLVFLGCEKEEEAAGTTDPYSYNPTELDGVWRGINNKTHKIEWDFTFYDNMFFLDDECEINSCAGLFSLNTTTTPKQIDIQILECYSDSSSIASAGDVVEGIYEIVVTEDGYWEQQQQMMYSYSLNISIPDSVGAPRPESFSDDSNKNWIDIDYHDPNGAFFEDIVGCCNPVYDPSGYTFEADYLLEYSSPSECSGDSTILPSSNNHYYTFTDSLVTSNDWPYDSDWELCESTLYRVIWSSWADGENAGEYSGGQVSYSGFTMTSDSTMYLQDDGDCYGGSLASFYDTYEECWNAGYLWTGCSRTYYTGTPIE